MVKIALFLRNDVKMVKIALFLRNDAKMAKIALFLRNNAKMAREMVKIVVSKGTTLRWHERWLR